MNVTVTFNGVPDDKAGEFLKKIRQFAEVMDSSDYSYNFSDYQNLKNSSYGSPDSGGDSGVPRALRNP